MLIFFWEICIFNNLKEVNSINKFKDIKEIYKIISVNNEYIITKSDNKLYKKYIYEVIPVTLLDFSVEVQNSIYMIYNEFLREMNLDLQIYISNKKMNIENYIDDLKNNIINQDKEGIKIFLTRYLNDMQDKLNIENIYITRYYIVITLVQNNEQNIEEIDNVMKKLNKLGCIVNRIVGIRNIEKILYESINKESIV